jgi:hypothetical protein
MGQKLPNKSRSACPTDRMRRAELKDKKGGSTTTGRTYRAKEALLSCPQSGAG